MHEFAATSELLRLVLSECDKAGLDRPTRVITELGSLTSFTAEAVQFYFETLKGEEPRLHDCTLEILPIRAMLRCSNCGRESAIEDPYLLFCPECPQSPVEILCGKDFSLKSIIGE